MARYELNGEKFWLIERSGTTLTTHWGKIGKAATNQTKTFPDEAAAQKEHDRLVRERTKAGYQEVSRTPAGQRIVEDGGAAKKSKPAPTSATASNPELLAAIEKDLDDEKAYLVYADWLQAQGDPRGELIVLQHGGKTTEANALIKKHKERLLGPLAAYPAKVDQYGGGKSLQLEWHLGFIRKAKITWKDFEDGDDDQEHALADFTAFLDLDSSRFVRELVLGPVPGDDGCRLDALADVMQKKKKPRHLRSLDLGNIGDWDISSTSTGGFSDIGKVFPELRTWILHGGEVSVRKIYLQELREFAVRTGQLSKKELADISKASWPKLEKLEIWFGDEERGASGALKDIKSILAGTGLSNLKQLGLMNCAWVDEICAELPRSAIAGRLESLDLSMGMMTKAGAASLVEGKSAFKMLKSLNVEDNYLSSEAQKMLKGFCDAVRAGKQKGDETEEYRYVSVSE